MSDSPQVQPLEEQFIRKADAQRRDMGIPANEDLAPPPRDQHPSDWERHESPHAESIYPGEDMLEDPSMDFCHPGGMDDTYHPMDDHMHPSGGMQHFSEDEPGRRPLDWRDYEHRSPVYSEEPDFVREFDEDDAMHLSSLPPEFSAAPQGFPMNDPRDQDMDLDYDWPSFDRAPRDWGPGDHVTGPSFPPFAQHRASSSDARIDDDGMRALSPSVEQGYPAEGMSECLPSTFVVDTHQKRQQLNPSMGLHQRFSRYPNATAEPQAAKVKVTVLADEPTAEEGQVVGDELPAPSQSPQLSPPASSLHPEARALERPNGIDFELAAGIPTSTYGAFGQQGSNSADKPKTTVHITGIASQAELGSVLKQIFSALGRDASVDFLLMRRMGSRPHPSKEMIVNISHRSQDLALAAIEASRMSAKMDEWRNPGNAVRGLASRRKLHAGPYETQGLQFLARRFGARCAYRSNPPDRRQPPAIRQGLPVFFDLEQSAESQAVLRMLNSLRSSSQPGPASRPAEHAVNAPVKAVSENPAAPAENGQSIATPHSLDSNQASTADGVKAARRGEAADANEPRASIPLTKPLSNGAAAKRKAESALDSEQPGTAAEPSGSSQISLVKQVPQHIGLPSGSAAKKLKSGSGRSDQQQPSQQLPSQQKQPPKAAAKRPILQPAARPGSGSKQRGGQRIEWTAGSSAKEETDHSPLNRTLDQRIAASKALQKAVLSESVPLTKRPPGPLRPEGKPPDQCNPKLTLAEDMQQNQKPTADASPEKMLPPHIKAMPKSAAPQQPGSGKKRPHQAGLNVADGQAAGSSQAAIRQKTDWAAPAKDISIGSPASQPCLDVAQQRLPVHELQAGQMQASVGIADAGKPRKSSATGRRQRHASAFTHFAASRSMSGKDALRGPQPVSLFLTPGSFAGFLLSGGRSKSRQTHAGVGVEPASAGVDSSQTYPEAGQPSDTSVQAATSVKKAIISPPSLLPKTQKSTDAPAQQKAQDKPVGQPSRASAQAATSNKSSDARPPSRQSKNQMMTSALGQQTAQDKLAGPPSHTLAQAATSNKSPDARPPSQQSKGQVVCGAPTRQTAQERPAGQPSGRSVQAATSNRKPDAKPPSLQSKGQPTSNASALQKAQNKPARASTPPTGASIQKPAQKPAAANKPASDVLAAMQAELEAQEAKVRALKAEAELKALRARIRAMEAQQRSNTPPLAQSTSPHSRPTSTAPNRITVLTPEPVPAPAKHAGREGQDRASGKGVNAKATQHDQRRSGQISPSQPSHGRLGSAADSKGPGHQAAKLNGAHDVKGSRVAAQNEGDQLHTGKPQGDQLRAGSPFARAAASRHPLQTPESLADQLLSSLEGPAASLLAAANPNLSQPLLQSEDAQEKPANHFAGSAMLSEEPGMAARSLHHLDSKQLSVLEGDVPAAARVDAAGRLEEEVGPMGSAEPEAFAAEGPREASAAADESDWVIDAGDFNASSLERADTLDSQGDVDIGS